MKSKLTGLVAATFTPLNADGEVDTDRVPALVDHLEKNGVKGIYINGSTGEGTSLTCDERREVASAYVSSAKGRLKTVVQVGSNSIKDSQALAAHAESLGVDAISSTSPSYFKPTSTEVLIRTVAEIASGAPNTPFYYYHIPAMTGIDISMVDFLETVGDAIPTIAGIKFASTALSEQQQCMHVDDGRFEILGADDAILMQVKITGAEGFIGSTFNFMAPVYLRIIDAVDHNDLETARRWQLKSLRAISAILDTCGRAGLKESMSFVGLDCGPSRLPIRSPGPKERESLRGKLDTMGFFEWIA